MNRLLQLLLLLPAVAFGQRIPFTVPGFDAVASATDFSYLNEKPAGAQGFARVFDGHFHNQAGRLRLWGVNVGYGACFPSHEEAEKVAAHLAKLGINCVRIHHHESQFSPTGLLHPDGRFDPKQVDRLDYFLAQLHRQGIYANLNLHVGRAASKRLKLPPLWNSFDTENDKFALHFEPLLQEAFRAFCREYLQHVNPYRGLKRADDPGIAMVEMCNENSFSRAGAALLLDAPEPYASSIRQRWNAWLKTRYTGLRLAEEWEFQDNPSRDLCEAAEWQIVNADSKRPLSLKSNGQVLRLEPRGLAKEAWHQQLSSPELRLEHPRSTYTLRFAIRADKARGVDLHLATTDSGKWEPLGLAETLEVETAWREHVIRIRSPRRNVAAQVTFSLGGDATAVEIRDLKIQSGLGEWRLPDGQSVAAGNVDLPTDAWPPAAQEALQSFMVDTERSFYSGMKSFLRDELGVKVPMLTTQIDFQPLQVANDVSDFVDMHVYWQHPIFPGEDWDPDNWHVQNESLLAFPFDNDWPRVNLTMRSGWRVHGKPFTISEWMAGDPNFFSADAIPVAGILASLQDWDAVFFFDYHNQRTGWNDGRIQNYFEMNGHPVKQALVASLANLYRRQDLPALQRKAGAPLHRHEGLGPLCFERQIGIDPTQTWNDFDPKLGEAANAVRNRRVLATPDESVRWEAEQSRCVINTPRTRGVWGRVAKRTFELGSWRVRLGATERDYAVIVATSRQPVPLEEASHILITAVGNAANRDMKWNSDRTSVGRNWGKGPTTVNVIPFELILPAGHKARYLYALDEQGRRKSLVKADTSTGASLRFACGSQETIWYELTTDAPGQP